MEIRVQINNGIIHSFGTTPAKPCTISDMVELLKRTEQWTGSAYTVKIDNVLVTDIGAPVGEGVLIKVEGK